MKFFSYFVNKIRNPRLLYLQLLFVTLAFALMVLTSGIFVYDMLKNNMKRDAENILIQTQIRILNELTEPETLMIPIVRETRNILLRGGTEEEVSEFFNEISADLVKKEKGFAFDGIHGYFDVLDGAYITSLGWTAPEGFDATTRTWYITGVEAEGKVAASPMFKSIRTDQYQISFVCQILDDEKKQLGVIAMNVLLNNISDFVSEAKMTQGGYGFLVSENFELVAHPAQNIIGREITEISPAFRAIVESIKQETDSITEVNIKNYQDTASIFYNMQMENGWYLGIMIPKDEYYKNFTSLLLFLGLLSFILMVTVNIILISIDRAKTRADKAFNEQSAALAGNLINILNSLDAMIYVTEPKTGKILFINDSMKEHYNIQGDCVGQICYKVFQQGLYSRCSFCPCFKLDEDPSKAIIWEEHSTKTNRIYRNVDRYISWPNGETVHIQHSVDMTELISAKELAEQSSRYKSAFLANVSHEVRTPMNAILGIAEIQLRDENVPPAAEEAFSKIYESGSLLLHIINDILDMSKIEAGKMELLPVKYDVPELISNSMQLNILRYESKPIKLKIDFDERTPQTLYGDELRIKQILNNILSNAFKYTYSGEVALSVSAEYPENEEKTAILIIKVSDTGQGMTSEQMSRLFDEYSRFNIEANRTTIGTGLGMNITKQLLDLMDGTITVESKVDEGSVFTVHIPQQRIGSNVCGAELAEKMRNFSFHSTLVSKKTQVLREYMPYGKVLIVDDVESNIYVAKGMLMAYGLYIETALSGFEAIEKIKDGSVYDIIFMDHMMPKMDGIEAVKNIRSMGYKNSIVALTANALVGQTEMFLENGFDGYLSKPIDSRELNYIVNDYIRNKQSPEVVQKARLEQARRKNRFVNNYKIKSSEIVKFFIHDAEKAISALKSMFTKENGFDDSNIEMYVVVIHGIKSALANIGERHLSDIAAKLEQAGRDKNLSKLTEETPAFINALQGLSAKHKEKNIIQEDSSLDIDTGFLREMLADFKRACGALDKKAAKKALNSLGEKNWPQDISAVLDHLSLLLLHSAFEEALSTAEVLNKNIVEKF